MNNFALKRRTWALIAVLVPLLVLFLLVALRSGPLAPVAVTVARVSSAPLAPVLSGIGTVEARHTYKIGPTVAGRVKSLQVQVGDRVQAGQVLGEMEVIDLDDRVRSQDAALKRAQAMVREAEARRNFALKQSQRYDKLQSIRAASEEMALGRRQELQIAEAGLAVAQEELARLRSDRAGLVSQRGNLQLLAPAAGLITFSEIEPGSTVVAGQAVVEMIDPTSLWINARLDQSRASGLAAGLVATITLRSRAGQRLPGRVLRVEPRADAVTEEILVKVVFEHPPSPLPPTGELAEITLSLPELSATPLISNAALRREGLTPGVWRHRDGKLSFAPVRLGATDLDGRMQVLEGLAEGDEIVIYSERPLNAHSRIRIVDHIAGVPR